MLGFGSASRRVTPALADTGTRRYPYLGDSHLTVETFVTAANDRYASSRVLIVKDAEDGPIDEVLQRIADSVECHDGAPGGRSHRPQDQRPTRPRVESTPVSRAGTWQYPAAFFGADRE